MARSMPAVNAGRLPVQQQRCWELEWKWVTVREITEPLVAVDVEQGTEGLNVADAKPW